MHVLRDQKTGKEITSLKRRLIALFSVYSGTKQSNILEQNMTRHYINVTAATVYGFPYLGPGFICAIIYVVPQSYWDVSFSLFQRQRCGSWEGVWEPLRFLTESDHHMFLPQERLWFTANSLPCSSMIAAQDSNRSTLFFAWGFP